jgi:putative acetyltransferase
MIVRKFLPDDLDAVLQLFYDVVHSVGAKYYDEKQVNAWAPQEYDRARWLNSLMENFTYVVEEHGIIIGFGDMTREGYIDRLFVHKNHQGRGAALRIFRKLEEDARRLGLKELTGEASVMLKPLAEKHGFEVIEKQNKVHRGVEFINYKMRKKLS